MATPQQMRQFWLICAALAALVLSACQQPQDGPGAPGASQPDGPAVSPQPYSGPAVTIDVLTQRMVDIPERVIVLETIAPTGGHEFVLDEAVIDEQEDTASLYVTLIQPGDDELVTQALVTHHLTHRDTTPFSEVQVFVRLHRRGEAPGEYRLAANE